MTKIELDGNKIAENEIEYLKESFDLPVFNGDYEDIYQYLIGYYTKTIVTLNNSNKVDKDLIDVFERASDYNNMVKFKKLD